jgi:hypothetical protein
MSLFFFNALQAHGIQEKNEEDVFLYKDNNNSEKKKRIKKKNHMTGN